MEPASIAPLVVLAVSSTGMVVFAVLAAWSYTSSERSRKHGGTGGTQSEGIRRAAAPLVAVTRSAFWNTFTDLTRSLSSDLMHRDVARSAPYAHDTESRFEGLGTPHAVSGKALFVGSGTPQAHFSLALPMQRLQVVPIEDVEQALDHLLTMHERKQREEHDEERKRDRRTGTFAAFVTLFAGAALSIVGTLLLQLTRI